MNDFNLQTWLDKIQDKITETFEKRVLFVGYQGSYRRDEATENSDIDVVVIIDDFSFEDLKKYKTIIKSMPYCEKACGFISGKKEIEKWSKSDIFQFINETKPLVGDLKTLVEAPSHEDIKKAIKISSENLYHATCHSFLYEENLEEVLQQLYKMTFFILQAEYFLQTEKYIATKLQLLEKLDGTDKEVLKTCIERENLKNLKIEEAENFYKQLMYWSCSSI